MNRKEQINRLCAQGNTWAGVARGLGISRQRLYKWIVDQGGTMWTDIGVDWGEEKSSDDELGDAESYFFLDSRYGKKPSGVTHGMCEPLEEE